MKPTSNGRVLSIQALGLTTALLLPANLHLNVFSKAEASVAPTRDLVMIDHESRVTHAQELLGRRTAEQAGITSSEVAESLETYIRNHVHSSLRDEDRPTAGTIARAILREAAVHGMDPIFLMSIVAQESRFNPRARGAHGEIGLMQIKPSTAEWIARRHDIEWRGAESLYEPATNIRLATLYFAWLRNSFARRPAAYVAAYNMGPVAVRRKLAENVMPYIYAADVMGRYRGHYRKLTSQIAAFQKPLNSPRREFTISMSLSQNNQVLGRVSN